MQTIYIKPPFITLGQFLKFINVISSGNEAKFFLSNHSVMVNDQFEIRRGRKLYGNDVIQIESSKYSISLSLGEEPSSVSA